jgi:hypothetical protein
MTFKTFSTILYYSVLTLYYSNATTVMHAPRIVCVCYSTVKVEIKSVLRIGSAHNNVRTCNVNIAQISNVSNFSEYKLYFIFI